jgi:hypothetical protein
VCGGAPTLAAGVAAVPPACFFLRSVTRPLAGEEERLAHIAELACASSEAEEKAQVRETNGTSGVQHGGGYFAPHGTDFYLRTQYSSTYGRPITYLMGGLLVEVHSSSYFCLPHARAVFSCGAPWCASPGTWKIEHGGAYTCLALVI